MDPTDPQQTLRRIVIIRHGKAMEQSATGRDADRCLRPRGEDQARYLGERLRELSPPPGLLLSSGLVRAVQTARLIQGVLECTLQIEPVLETGHAAKDVLELVGEHRGDSATLGLVGHNPQLEELVFLLTEQGAAVRDGLRTGEAVVLASPPDGRCRVERTLRLPDEGEA